MPSCTAFSPSYFSRAQSTLGRSHAMASTSAMSAGVEGPGTAQDRDANEAAEAAALIAVCGAIARGEVWQPAQSCPAPLDRLLEEHALGPALYAALGGSG